MHRVLPTLLALASLAGQAATCPPAPHRFVERAIGADCLACWQAADKAPARSLLLDWIVPVGDEAELAVGALAEGRERFAGAALPARREQALPSAKGVRLQVDSGLAFNGYIGLNFRLKAPRRAAWPADAVGYVALVERIPAGSDGSGSARQLVRAIAGPLSLVPPSAQAPLQHLVAVRLPSNGDPARFAAVGWVETADRRVLLAAASPPHGCNSSTHP